MSKFSRRGFLKVTALGGAAMAAMQGCASNQKKEFSFDDQEGFTFAHLTDSHVRRKRQGHLGYEACIQAVNNLEPNPELVLMGGDMVFDGCYTEKEDWLDQVELVRSLSDQLNMPWYGCLGNHDALGLNGRRKVALDDPQLGKEYLMEKLGMPAAYYSFDAHGWHFVVLDSNEMIEHPEYGPVTIASIGEEQREWLANDLGKNAGKPTVVVTHVALFCANGQIDGNQEAKAMSLVISENRQVREILERHGVKAVLQGHSHMIEDYKYNGVWYITSPAVSGCWWSGEWNGHPAGFTLLKATPDGELVWERKGFEWEWVLEPEDTLEKKKIEERKAFEQEQKRLLEEERGVLKALRCEKSFFFL